MHFFAFCFCWASIACHVVFASLVDELHTLPHTGDYILIRPCRILLDIAGTFLLTKWPCVHVRWV